MSQNPEEMMSDTVAENVIKNYFAKTIMGGAYYTLERVSTPSANFRHTPATRIITGF
jgi:hypothetical protein